MRLWKHHQNIKYIKSSRFRHVKDSFQRELSKGIRKIKSSPNAFVFADKANKIYEMPKDHHKKLLHYDVTKIYRKAPRKLEASIKMEAKSISTRLKISDRVERIEQHLLF